MKFIVRLFEDSYEELITYYPRFYRDVREMVAILHAHGRLCDVLEDNIDLIYNNNFIDYMDEETLTKLEDFLGIALNKQRSLEERRRLVKAYFVGSGHVSASMLEEMIYAYTGSEVDITFEPFDEEGNNRLIIRIERGSEDILYMDDILTLLSKKLPAHIYYRADLWYDFPAVVIGGGRVRHTNTLFEYPLCGTIPDDAYIGALAQYAAVIDRKTTEVTTDYDQAAEDGLQAGQKPITIRAGVYNEISTAAEAQVSAGGVDYIFCGEDVASSDRG